MQNLFLEQANNILEKGDICGITSKSSQRFFQLFDKGYIRFFLSYDFEMIYQNPTTLREYLTKRIITACFTRIPIVNFWQSIRTLKEYVDFVDKGRDGFRLWLQLPRPQIIVDHIQALDGSESAVQGQVGVGIYL